MSKKRPLSPGASSHSSATPAPSSVVPLGLSGLNGAPALGSALDGGLASDHPVAGPSRHGSSATPAPPPVVGEKTYAKHGNIVLGSGDGTAWGEECYSWDGLPMNKGAYRYAPCGSSPNPSPSKLVPFYRTIPYGPDISKVHISFVDRSPFLRLSTTAMTASADRGYRSARANVSVREGSWYYEVLVERGNGATGAGRGSAPKVGMQDGNAHVRVGWGRREASLEMPVGADGYSYALRDVGGEKIHLSRPKSYGSAFATGDVIGCLITLPPRRPPPEFDDRDPAMIKRRRAPLNYKGQHYFEMNEYLPSREMETLVDREGKLAAAAKAAEEAKQPVPNGESGAKVNKKKATTKNAKKSKEAPTEEVAPKARPLHTLPESRIEFYLNGKPLGTAFEDLYDFIPLPPLFKPSSTRRHGYHPFDPLRDVLHDDGTLGYYPMVSCFGRGKVRVNFGPTWLHPPPELDARAVVERWDEFREEERLLDEQEEAEMASRLRKEIEEEARKKALWEAKALKPSSSASASNAKRAPAGGKIKGKKEKMGSTGRNTPVDSLKGTPIPSGASSPDETPTEIVGEVGTPVKVERASEAPPSSRKTQKSKSRSRSRATSVKSSTAEGPVALGVDVDAEPDAVGEADEGIAWDPA